MALGSILGSVAALVVALCWFWRKPDTMLSAILAGR